MKLKGFTNAQISYAIYEYKSTLPDFKVKELSTTTIKKYFEIAEDYIEERYQELITGKVKKSVG
jgi:hypothetical protein